MLLHVSVTGQPLRTLTLDFAKLIKPAGLALAPSNLGNGATSFFDGSSMQLVGLRFADASATSTTASLPLVGTYRLLLTANDGQASASDAIEFTSSCPPTTRRRRYRPVPT